MFSKISIVFAIFNKMDKKKIVITGLGVLASNGIGKDSFTDAVFDGVSGVKPISLFDASSFKAKTAAQIVDFNPDFFLGAKGLRVLDRSTKLICSAMKLALDDAHRMVSEENTHRTGVVVAATFGSIDSICEFDKTALTDGPQYVNPAFFPNTVLNSPASQVSIKFNIKGFNTTISTGFSASLDAVKYALDFLRLGRADMVLVGTVEELSVHNFLGFYKAGVLAGLRDDLPEFSCPFDKRRNGIVLGEAAGAIVLEDYDYAIERRANIYARVSGFGSGSRDRAMHKAIQDAGLDISDIDYISSSANSSAELDKKESLSIKEVFGGNRRPFVSSIKSMLGECFSAAGILQTIAGCGAIVRQEVPPTINYAQSDPDCDLNYAVNTARQAEINNVLINSFAMCGNNSSLVISKE